MQVSRKESDKASSFLPANKRSKEPQICHDDIEGEVKLNSRGLGMGRVYTHQQMYPQIRLYSTYLSIPFKRTMIVQVNIITIYKPQTSSFLLGEAVALWNYFL